MRADPHAADYPETDREHAFQDAREKRFTPRLLQLVTELDARMTTLMFSGRHHDEKEAEVLYEELRDLRLDLGDHEVTPERECAARRRWLMVGPEESR